MKIFCFLFVTYLHAIKHVERKLGEELNDEDYLDYLKPTNKNLRSVKQDTERLAFVEASNKKVAQINSKLQQMKFIVNKRLEEMGERVAKQLRGQGYSPIIKYHQSYNYLMNPFRNPYLQMALTNKMMAPPGLKQSEDFLTFQKNLEQFGNTYAEALANLKSGMFGNPTENAFQNRGVD